MDRRARDTPDPHQRDARLLLVASLPLRSWHLAFAAICAAVFFTFIYQDTGFLNRMEASTRRITQQLPFGTRTLSTIFAPNDYRTIYLHIPDRACIGHCFLVSNYEPSTRQFRVRVQPGSRVVTASDDDSEDMQSGTYDVEDEDLPLKQIYQCQANDLTKICIRDLAEDEKTASWLPPHHESLFLPEPLTCRRARHIGSCSRPISAKIPPG